MKTTHGLSRSNLYRVWKFMIHRCTNPKQTSYEKYGGAGIKVCDEWLDDFINFNDWAEKHGYKDGLILSRIDDKGDFTPDNCKFINRKAKANELGSENKVKYRGREYFISELAVKFGLEPHILFSRLRNDWSVAKALNTPVREKSTGKYTYNGETKSLKQLADEAGINYSTLLARIKNGLSIEEAINFKR